MEVILKNDSIAPSGTPEGAMLSYPVLLAVKYAPCYENKS